MGQKIHPIGFRMGISATWQSRWFSDPKKYKQLLLQDIKIRQLLAIKIKAAGIIKIETERAANKLKVMIFVSRPGILIGRGGVGLIELKKYLMQQLDIKDENSLEIAPMDVKVPDLSANLLAQSVAEQLAKRLPAQRVMNQIVDRAMKAGAKGVRVMLSGRIGGAEIARRESKTAGSMPLHTLRLHLAFASVPAMTKSGFVGVKVWINKGEATI